ncbi:hypothetical protein NST84_14265 [Paenibacillus sp. FSL R7-0345]
MYGKAEKLLMDKMVSLQLRLYIEGCAILVKASEISLCKEERLR